MNPFIKSNKAFNEKNIASGLVGWAAYDNTKDGDWVDLDTANWKVGGDDNPYAIKLSTDIILFAYIADDTHDLMLLALTRSDDSITVVTETVVDAGDGLINGRITLHPVPGSSTDFLIAYTDYTGTNGTYVRYCDFTSGTFTVDSAVNMHSDDNGGLPLSTATEGLMVRENGNINTNLFTLSGRTITKPTTSFTSYATNADAFAINLSTDLYAIAAHISSSGFRVLTIRTDSGSLDTYGDTVVNYASATTYVSPPIRLNDSTALMSMHGHAIVFSDDGTTFKPSERFGTPGVFNYGGLLEETDDGDFIVGCGYTANSYDDNAYPAIVIYNIKDNGSGSFEPTIGNQKIIDDTINLSFNEESILVQSFSDGYACAIINDTDDTKIKAKVLVRP